MANIQLLKDKANEMRKDIVKMVCAAKSGHPGGSLSAADIMSVLYFHEMNVDPQNPKDPKRDRFVLSKGHAAPVLYSALAERGYFDKELLETLRKFGSPLQGHPDMKKLKGVEMSTGSLGQGLSAGNGMALSAKIFGDDFRTYVLMGDGEQQEGQIWEAAMTASHYKLDNICAILDFNNLQIDGKVSEVMGISPIDKKWESFGWNVIIVDGHDIEALIDAFEKAKLCKGKPSIIIANTIKGKGISFMEDKYEWHGVAPSVEEMEKAIAELENIECLDD